METSIAVNLDEDTLEWIDEIYDSQSAHTDLNLVQIEDEDFHDEFALCTPIQDEQNRKVFVCVVCGAPAHGFNFDQLTCESCKAFFRRNAMKDLVNMKCRYEGSCIINEVTRRQCVYCRLKKCFDMKMRKDWIRTDEERRIRDLIKKEKQLCRMNGRPVRTSTLEDFNLVHRRKKRLNHRTIDLLVKSTKSFGINIDLSEMDRMLINNILSTYRIAKISTDLSHLDRLDSSTSLVEFLNCESQSFRTLVIFMKKIPEFHTLDISDQVLLIKRNLSTIIHLHHTLVSDFFENPKLVSAMMRWTEIELCQKISKARSRLKFFEHHPDILELILVVFLFETNLSTPHCIDDEVSFKNLSKIVSIQNNYIELLWKYLNSVFNDDEQSRKSIEMIVIQMLQFQSAMNRFEDHLCAKNFPRPGMDPLVESIFRLT